MTHEHLSDEQLTAFVNGELHGDALLDADDHLTACASCREHLSRRTDAHLSYSDLESICDGRSPRAAHLLRCRECAEALAGLETVREGLAPRKPQRPRLAAMVAVAASLATILLIIRKEPPAPSPVAPPSVPVATVAQAPAGETLVDGDRVLSIDAEGRVRGLATDAKTLATVEAMLRGTVTSPPTEALRAKTGVLLGDTSPEAGATLVSPLAIVVRDDTPEFRWTPDDLSARVSVYDADFEQVAASDGMATGSWSPSAPLKRGRLYRWQLTIRRNGAEVVVPEPPQPEALFAVLSESALREVETAERAHAGSRLLLSATYLQAGLLDDAERELRLLAEANPRSPIARELLETVRKLRETPTPRAGS